MSNSLAVLDQARLPARFAKANAEVNTDLSDGVRASFAILSIRGSRWRIKYQGSENAILRDGEPVAGLNLVIVAARKEISKIYYDKPYEPGSDTAPTCFSIDGIKPHASSAAKQARSCAECRHNVWGSKVSDSGVKSKACSDSRRLAVVPAGNIENKAVGGPMLLRVPAASLGALTEYAGKLSNRGFPYFAVATKVAFDPNSEYPKLTFDVVDVVSDEDAELIEAWRDSDIVRTILETTEDVAVPGDDPADDLSPKADAEAAGVAERPAAKAQAKAKAKAKPVEVEVEPAPQQEPEPAPAAEGDDPFAAFEQRFKSATAEPEPEPEPEPKPAAKVKAKAKPAPDPEPSAYEEPAATLDDEGDDSLSNKLKGLMAGF